MATGKKPYQSWHASKQFQRRGHFKNSTKTQARQHKRIHSVWKASIITRQGQWQQHTVHTQKHFLSSHVTSVAASHLLTSERQMSKAGDRINRSFSFDTLYIPHLAAVLPMLTSGTLSSLRIKQYDRLPRLFTKLFLLARHQERSNNTLQPATTSLETLLRPLP